MHNNQPNHREEIIAPSKQPSLGNPQTCGAELNQTISTTDGDKCCDKRRIWIANFPFDGRWGVERISCFLKTNTPPKIDLESQKDTVVVVSRSRKVAKVISFYNKKYEVRVCTLRQGRYQHLVATLGEGDFREVSKSLLEVYLEGGKLDIKRYTPKLWNF